MVSKVENNNNISKWYELTSDIGKQMIEVSNIGTNNYNILQESWQDYSGKMEYELTKFLRFDVNQPPNMFSIWKTMGKSIGSEMEKINNLEKQSYYQFYQSWLKNTQSIVEDISNLFQLQIGQQTSLIKKNEMPLKVIGFEQFNFNGFTDILRSMTEVYIHLQNENLKILSKSMQTTAISESTQEFFRVPNIWKEVLTDSIELYFNNMIMFTKMFGFDQNRKMSDDLKDIKNKVNELSNKTEELDKKQSSKKN